MRTWQRLICAAASLAIVGSPALAAPPGASSTAIASATNGDVIKVWRGGGWGWRGPWPWIGLGAGVVAGAIIADRTYAPRPGYYYDDYAYDGPYYYPSDYRGDPRVICAREFRSFDWRSGYYTTYSGERRLCPYLH